jgi:hypothetical protein
LGQFRVLAHIISEPPLTLEQDSFSLTPFHFGYDGALGFCKLVDSHGNGERRQLNINQEQNRNRIKGKLR